MENTDNNDNLILSPNKKHIPKPSIVEHRLRSGLEDRFCKRYNKTRPLKAGTL